MVWYSLTDSILRKRRALQEEKRALFPNNRAKMATDDGDAILQSISKTAATNPMLVGGLVMLMIFILYFGSVSISSPRTNINSHSILKSCNINMNDFEYQKLPSSHVDVYFHKTLPRILKKLKTGDATKAGNNYYNFQQSANTFSHSIKNAEKIHTFSGNELFPKVFQICEDFQKQNVFLVEEKIQAKKFNSREFQNTYTRVQHDTKIAHITMNLTKSIFQGMIWFQSKNVIFQDLTYNNLVYDQHHNLKIIDIDSMVFHGDKYHLSGGFCVKDKDCPGMDDNPYMRSELNWHNDEVDVIKGKCVEMECKGFNYEVTMRAIISKIVVPIFPV